MALNQHTKGTTLTGRLRSKQVDTDELKVGDQTLDIPQEVADDADVATVVTALKAAGIFIDPA